MKNIKTTEDIQEKIKRIKPFYEQLTFFFLFLFLFVLFTLIFQISTVIKYTMVVVFMAWSISLIIQELYTYKVFKPVLLGKRWDQFVSSKINK